MNSNEGVVVGPPLIDEGEYICWKIDHRLVKNHHGFGDKLIIDLRIVGGDDARKVVSAFYNIDLTEDGGFTCPRAGRWAKEIHQLCPDLNRPKALETKDIQSSRQCGKPGEASNHAGRPIPSPSPQALDKPPGHRASGRSRPPCRH